MSAEENNGKTTQFIDEDTHMKSGTRQRHGRYRTLRHGRLGPAAFISAVMASTMLCAPTPLSASSGLEPGPRLAQTQKVADTSFCIKVSGNYECPFDAVDPAVSTFSNTPYARALDGVLVDVHVKIPSSCSDTVTLISFFNGGTTAHHAHNNPLGREYWGLAWNCRLQKIVILTVDNFASGGWTKAASNSGFRQNQWITAWPIFSSENLKGQTVGIKAYVSRANSYIEVASKHRFHHTHKRVQKVNWIGYGNTIGYMIERSIATNGDDRIYIRGDGHKKSDSVSLFGFRTSPVDTFADGKGYFTNAPLADQLMWYGAPSRGKPENGDPYTLIEKRKGAPLKGFPQRAKGVLSTTRPE